MPSGGMTTSEGIGAIMLSRAIRPLRAEQPAAVDAPQRPRLDGFGQRKRGNFSQHAATAFASGGLRSCRRLAGSCHTISGPDGVPKRRKNGVVARGERRGPARARALPKGVAVFCGSSLGVPPLGGLRKIAPPTPPKGGTPEQKGRLPQNPATPWPNDGREAVEDSRRLPYNNASLER